MKRGIIGVICLICLLAPRASVRAVANETAPVAAETVAPAAAPSPDADSPYSAIWLRNVFELKPIPPPEPTNKPPPPEPPPGVTLTGITTILGRKEALFMVKEKPVQGKPPPKDESYILTEGERQGPLEVLEIHTKDQTVKIKVDGEISTITFETNKPPSGPVGGAPGGGIPRAPGFTPPGFNPRSVPFNNGGAPGSFPSRTMRPSADATPFNQGGYNNNAYQQGGIGGYGGGGYVAPGTTAGAGTTPGLSLPGFGSSTPTPNYRPAPEATPPEVTGAILILQQAAADAASTPFPPLPPPFVVGGSGSGAGANGSQGSTPELPPVPGGSSAPAPPALPGYTQPVVHGNFH